MSEIESLISQITQQGLMTLDPKLLNKILIILRGNSTDYSIVYASTWKMLSKSHAQIRYACVLLIDVLIKEFQPIRSLLMEDLDEFILHCVNIPHPTCQCKGLKPKKWADQLHSLTLQTLKNWKSQFENDRPLQIAYTWLKEEFGISFIDIAFQTQRPSNRRRQSLQNQKYIQILSLFDENWMHFNENIRRIESCFELLFQITSGSGSSEQEKKQETVTSSKKSFGKSFADAVHEYGLGSQSYELHVPLQLHIQETPENHVVFQELRECKILLESKHLFLVKKWIKELSRIDSQDQKEHEIHLKTLLDLKNDMLNVLIKLEKMGIQEKDTHILLPMDNVQGEDSLYNDDDEEEEEFVPADSNIQPLVILKSSTNPTPYKPIYELQLQSHSTFTDLSECVVSKDSINTNKSTSINQDDARDSDKVIDSKRAQLLAIAPIVKYDTDLDYWDKTQVPFNSTGIEFQHRFMGTGSGERYLSQETLSQLKKRTIVLDDPVLEQQVIPCRAPLPSGGTCPRKDLIKCPIHGKIIPRDEFGFPLDPSFSIEPSFSSSKELQEWEKIEKDIELATLDHSNKNKGKRRLDTLNGTIGSKQRISKRLAKKTTVDKIEHDLKIRDRNAFKW